VKLRGLNET